MKWMQNYAGSWKNVFAAALILLLMAGCGGSSSAGGTTTTPSGPAAATVTLAASSSSPTTAQSVTVTVTVSTSATASPSGTVVLSSGPYASFPATVSGGTATVTVPAGLLPVGNATLTVAFTSAAPQTYSNASGTTVVAVTSAGTAPAVTASSTAYNTYGSPFRAVQTSLGDLLVSETDSTHVRSGIQVFTLSNGTLQSNCFNQLRPAFQTEGIGVLGTGLFNNGANFAAAIGDEGVLFFTTAALHTCSAQGAQVSQGALASGEGAFDVTVTADGKYAFVANEYGVASGATTPGNIGVVQLQYDISGTVTTGSTLLGQISTGGNAIAGVLLSPDGTRLYVTSEINVKATASGGSNPVLSRTGCLQQAGGTPQINGILTVIDVAKAEASPSSSAIIATVDAGCSPVRMVETSNRGVLWVSARGDNRVLAFSPGMLETNPDNALLGYADSGGTAPVGLTLFHNQQLLAVANSNRFNPGAYGNLTILSVASPYTAAVVQTVAAGLFPREVTAGSDDNTLFLTNYTSGSVQVVTPSVH